MQKSRFAVIAVGLLFVGAGCASFVSDEFEKEYSFVPALTNVQQRDFACTSVASANVGSIPGNGKVVAGVTGEPMKLSLSFGSDKMKLITAAAIEIGETEAAEFSIVEDDDSNYVAIAKLGVLGPNYNVLVFDKKTQQAVWSKASNAIMKYGEVIYLNCQ